MALKRRRFQGVLNILSFNRHFYVFGLISLGLLIAIAYFFNWPPWLFYLVITSFSYGLIAPLLISAYVYDFSGFYNFKWLEKFQIIDTADKINLNINAGFDETSFIIKDRLPLATLQVYDFYNPNQHTEQAIARARKASNIYPNTRQIRSDYIPLADNSVDNIFLISAVHEIRKFEEKVQFLKECKRISKFKGKVIMVEHLRDLHNFMAFTIGFTHFYSKKTWMKAFKEAGFTSFEETKFTPFMSIFYCY